MISWPFPTNARKAILRVTSIALIVIVFYGMGLPIASAEETSPLIQFSAHAQHGVSLNNSLDNYGLGLGGRIGYSVPAGTAKVS